MGSMLVFKEFRCDRIVLDRIEVMHMIAKGQMKCARGTTRQPPNEFYSLMTQEILNIPNQFALITLFSTEPLCPCEGPPR
jgi:deoxycytidine triphosphate deaminase